MPYEHITRQVKSQYCFLGRIDAPEFILDTIRHGYKILFIHEPTRMIMTNNNSAYVHRDFVEEALQEPFSEQQNRESSK